MTQTPEIEAKKIAGQQLGHGGGSEFFQRTVDRGYRFGLADPSHSLSIEFRVRTVEILHQFKELDDVGSAIQEAKETRSAAFRKKLLEQLGNRPLAVIGFLRKMRDWERICDLRELFGFYWENYGSAADAVYVGDKIFYLAAKKLGKVEDIPWILVRDVAAHAVRAEEYGLAQARLNEALRVFGEIGGAEATEGQAYSYFLRGRLTLESSLENLSTRQRFDKALRDFQTALEFAEKGSIADLAEEVDINVAGIFGCRGETEEALEKLGRILARAYKNKNLSLIFHGLMTRGELSLRTEQRWDAAADFERARLASYGNLYNYGIASLSLAKTHYEIESQGMWEGRYHRIACLILGIQSARDAVDSFATVSSPSHAKQARDTYNCLYEVAPKEILVLLDDAATMRHIYPTADREGLTKWVQELNGDS